MQLRHFTIPQYIDSIMEHGLLSIQAKREKHLYGKGNSGPSVPEMFAGEDNLVWLTRGDYIHLGNQDLAVIEFDSLPEALAWRTNHAKFKVPPMWLRVLEKSALEISPNNLMKDWYVVEGGIAPDKISRTYVVPRKETNALHLS